MLELLFELANFHALAKLRLHTDVTVDLLEVSTDHMYRAMTSFAQTTCAAYDVYERADEVDARVRRQRVKDPNAPVDGVRKKVEFNTINTFKYHVLGHYPIYIRIRGPLDNYSTQTVRAQLLIFLHKLIKEYIQGELEHKHVKRLYGRTNKGDHASQIARKQHFMALLRKLATRDTEFTLPSEARRQTQDDHLARAEWLDRATDSDRSQFQEALRQQHARTLAHATQENEVHFHPSHKRRASQFPTGVNPLAHYEVSQGNAQVVRIYNRLAGHDGDPTIKVSDCPLVQRTIIMV